MSEGIDATISRMREMKMGNLANKLQEMTDDPNFGTRTASEVLEELFMHEYSSRKTRKFNKLLSRAHLKYPSAVLDQSMSDPDRKIDMKLVSSLSGCRWIEEKKNLIITGKTGTGKSYCSNALAICAIQKGIHVLYAKTSLMINELNDCQFTGSYAAALKKYTDTDLLILDDFGLMSLDIQKCQQMFEVLDSREGSKSIIVISQIPVSKWYDIFQNNVYADACMSRLVSNAYRLELDGRDMRKSSSASGK